MPDKTEKGENSEKVKCDICGKPAIGVLVRKKDHNISLPGDLTLCHDCASAILVVFGCLLISSEIKSQEILRLLNNASRGKNKKQMNTAVDLIMATHSKK